MDSPSGDQATDATANLRLVRVDDLPLVGFTISNCLLVQESRYAPLVTRISGRFGEKDTKSGCRNTGSLRNDSAPGAVNDTATRGSPSAATDSDSSGFGHMTIRCSSDVQPASFAEPTSASIGI